jgi:5-formyltetrahydrofolate cyclo-ligase
MPDVDPATLSKPELRRLMRAALHMVPADEMQSRSKSLLHHLTIDDRWLARGGVVALFGGLPEEPDLLPLIAWLHERSARAVLFAVDGKILVPYEVRSMEDLRRGTLGVWEPVVDPARSVSPADLTTILTPALAYGQSDGSRIGRGAGYYDRLFGGPGVKANRIGIAFDLQVVPHIPTEAHDARVDAIVTESGWTRF